MNTFSGVGSERDTELQGGIRQSVRSYISGVDREHATFPLGLSQEIRHRDLVGGDLVSMKEGKLVPLDPSCEFAGVLENVAEDSGRYKGSVTTRGAIVVRVEGLSPETRSGSRVYALPGIRTVFTLDDKGVEIGEFLAAESLERGMAIVGVRVPSDTRRFETSDDPQPFTVNLGGRHENGNNEPGTMEGGAGRAEFVSRSEASALDRAQ